jgi:hypothetical protein
MKITNRWTHLGEAQLSADGIPGTNTIENGVDINNCPIAVLNGAFTAGELQDIVYWLKTGVALSDYLPNCKKA